MDEAGRPHVEVDPAQADFSRLLQADGLRAKRLRAVRQELAAPIHFLRGNHEDFRYLSDLPRDEADGTARVDGFDLLRYVPDGAVLRFGDLRIAFLGGIETERPDPRSIDMEGLSASYGPGCGVFRHPCDPTILRTGWVSGIEGQISGSKLITRLIEHTRPSFHFSGHVHHLNGPRSYGRTWSWSLDCLIASVRWHPEENGFRMGCLAVLDTDTGFLQPVTDSWLREFDTRGFDFDSW